MKINIALAFFVLAGLVVIAFGINHSKMPKYYTKTVINECSEEQHHLVMKRFFWDKDSWRFSYKTKERAIEKCCFLNSVGN